jgi:hypothetical protein
MSASKAEMVAALTMFRVGAGEAVMPTSMIRALIGQIRKGALPLVSQVDWNRFPAVRGGAARVTSAGQSKLTTKTGLYLQFIGVSDGIRTHDIQDHN